MIIRFRDILPCPENKKPAFPVYETDQAGLRVRLVIPAYLTRFVCPSNFGQPGMVVPGFLLFFAVVLFFGIHVAGYTRGEGTHNTDYDAHGAVLLRERDFLNQAQDKHDQCKHCGGKNSVQDTVDEGVFRKLHTFSSLRVLLSEIPLQQALEGFAVAGFVPCHFMDGVIVGLRPTGGNGNTRSLHWNYRLSRHESLEHLTSLIL